MSTGSMEGPLICWGTSAGPIVGVDEREQHAAGAVCRLAGVWRLKIMRGRSVLQRYRDIKAEFEEEEGEEEMEWSH